MTTQTSRTTIALAQKRTPLPRVNSGNLLQGSNILLIEHNGYEYQLRLTQSDKLILTK